MSHKLTAVLISGRPQVARTRPGLFAFGERTVVERTIAAYAGFAQVVLVVSGDREGFPADSGNLTVITVAENASVAEQLRSGVARLDGGHAGFATGLLDQPLLQQALVDAMAARFLAEQPKVLVPLSLRQIGQPAFFHGSLAPSFAKLRDDETAWHVLKAHGDAVQVFDTNETSVLRNIEDLDDYHALLQLAGLPVPVPVEE